MISAINSLTLNTNRIQPSQQPSFKALAVQQNNNQNVNFKGKVENILFASLFAGGGILNAIGIFIKQNNPAANPGPQIVEGLGIAGMIIGALPILWKIITNKNIMAKEPMKGIFAGLGIASVGAGLSQIPKSTHFSDMPYAMVGAGFFITLIAMIVGVTHYLTRKDSFNIEEK